MEQIGNRPPNRMPVLEEVVEVVRALLCGEELTYDGRAVHLDKVVLEHPPAEPPPILIGTTGPRGLALAGRSADGIVVVETACPAAVEWARGAAAPDPGRVIVYCFLSIEDDDAAGIVAIRPQIEAWMTSGAFPDMAEQAGLGRDGSGPLSDAVLQTIAAAGTPNSCRRTVEGLWSAGADSVVLLPRAGDGIAQFERFGSEVLPTLRTARRSKSH